MARKRRSPLSPTEIPMIWHVKPRGYGNNSPWATLANQLGRGHFECKKRNVRGDSILHLFVMRPHAKYANLAHLLEDFIDKAVVNVDSP